MASDLLIAPEKPHPVLFGKSDTEKRGSDSAQLIDPPRVRDDPWFWLRDDERKDKAVLGWLQKEADHAKGSTSHLDGFRKVLYDEHISHLKQTDSQTPYPYGEFYYYTRTVEGKSYKLHCRRKCAGDDADSPPLSAARVEASESAEELLLDINVLGEGKPHCDVRGVKPSPSHARLAYSVDYSGDETYGVFVRDIASGEIVDGAVKACAGSVTWGGEDFFFYVAEDAAKRPYQVWRHDLGKEQGADTLIFEEKDELFNLHAWRCKSGAYVFIDSGSSETSEVRAYDLRTGDVSLIRAREFKIKYDVDHIPGAAGGAEKDGTFLIVTNKDGATEMRVMVAAESSPEEWKELLPYDKGMKIDAIEPFKDYLMIEGRQGGLTRVWAMSCDDGAPQPETLRLVNFDDDAYEVGISVNKKMDTRFCRVAYSSLARPTVWYDVDMRALMASGATDGSSDTAVMHIAKEQQVLNYDGSVYRTARVFAEAPDGARVPISIVYHKDAFEMAKKRNGEEKSGDADAAAAAAASEGKEEGSFSPPVAAPMMLYGYGSYEICVDPGFDRRILPYLDRGVVYAIAHIRGGGEMGRHWYYDQGKYLNKRNTFSDFIACAEKLVSLGWTTKDQIAIEGRSAGGLLVGAVINMRPDLFKVAVAGVPFVDVMTTMSDPSIPLTTGEWEEWGNPNDYRYFDYMLSYSPYDNVRPQAYPHLLITAGLHDPRVAYWEPAKWASKLRKTATAGPDGLRDVIFKIDLDSGHFSASDRYKYLREKAWEQAYVMEKLGVAAEEISEAGTVGESKAESKM